MVAAATKTPPTQERHTAKQETPKLKQKSPEAVDSDDEEDDQEGVNPDSSVPKKKAEPVYNKEYALEPMSAGKELPNLKTKVGQAILNQVVREIINNILEEQKKM